jgi:hypothetical protein
MPKNQLDALPLYSAAAAASGGSVGFNPNGGITRFFDAPTLNVSGIARSDQGAGARDRYSLVTNYIDVRGCTSFACQIRRLTQGTLAVLPAPAGLFMQYRFSATDTPPPTPDTTSAEIVVAMSLLNTAVAALAFPNPAALALPQTALVTWNVAQTVGAAGANVFIGTDVRLIFSWATNDPGTATFSMTLWGSS